METSNRSEFRSGSRAYVACFPGVRGPGARGARHPRRRELAGKVSLWIRQRHRVRCLYQTAVAARDLDRMVAVKDFEYKARTDARVVLGHRAGLATGLAGELQLWRHQCRGRS
jgi:hypothetical protein